MSELVVMKFGGTSIGSAERIKNVAGIVGDARQIIQPVVVVSAMATVTDSLLNAAIHAASKQRSKLELELLRLKTLHMDTIVGLQLSDHEQGQLDKKVEGLLSELTNLLESIYLLGELTPRARDMILSFGERFSIQLVASAFTSAGVDAKAIEASQLIVTNESFGNARPLLEESIPKTKSQIKKLLAKNKVPVITGFIGATTQGITTTLGRGGSDYTATIIGHCLDADEVWIFTDVDGAMTADPRIIPNARTIPALSYAEAAELSYFGAKVLHPLTMVPASLKNIPIWVKNTFNPDAPGTRIARHVYFAEKVSKAISSMNGLSLVTVQGQGMSGVPGIAAKVFSSIAAQNINVLLISQASSEYNICFVVKQDDGAKAVSILRKAFESEMKTHSIESVKLDDNLAIMAVVGEGMRGYPGMAGMIFSSLGDAGVNIVAIAQGSSELNISLVVAQDDVTTAVQCVHDVFHLTDSRVRPK
jgi:aspartate kinase